jgi:hypothetical protein
MFLNKNRKECYFGSWAQHCIYLFSKLKWIHRKNAMAELDHCGCLLEKTAYWRQHRTGLCATLSTTSSLKAYSPKSTRPSSSYLETWGRKKSTKMTLTTH